MRRGGTPDPDCPECLESIVYLISKKRDITQKEMVSQTGEARIGVATTPESVGSLLSLTSAPAAPSGRTLAADGTDAILGLAAGLRSGGAGAAGAGSRLIHLFPHKIVQKN